MAEPIDPASHEVVEATGRSPQATVGYVLTSLPIMLIVVLMVVAPGFMDPLFSNPPAIAGLPAGVVFLFLALVWAVLGILVGRTARSVGIALTLVAFTLPASMAVLLGPAAILIIQNLAT